MAGSGLKKAVMLKVNKPNQHSEHST
jgi:hypothetical protein